MNGAIWLGSDYARGAVLSGLRDYPPAELEIWLKHVSQARKDGKTEMSSILPNLHKELLERGFIKKGWWDTLLKDAEEMTPTN